MCIRGWAYPVKGHDVLLADGGLQVCASQLQRRYVGFAVLFGPSVLQQLTLLWQLIAA